MPDSATDDVSHLLRDEYEDILTAWIDTQKAEGVRRTDLFSEAEGREQTGRLLSAMTRGIDAAATGDRFDLREDAWSDLREALASITQERVERGVTPSEMALFVTALKETVFERLRGRLQANPDVLMEQVWLINRVIDAFAIYTSEVFQEAKDAIIERQQAEMMELSTPVVQLWDGILTLPLIGTLDSARAQDVMERLLEAILERQAEVVIIDITGVQTVDTQVAQHLVRTAAAVRLMGAECIISGISPRIAQTMVQLGIDVGEIVTRASIQSAIVFALKKVGVAVVATAGSETA